MKLLNILKPEKVIFNLDVKDKTEAINKLVDLFENDNRVKDIQKVRKAVLERENIMSTGVGHGFAIPHGKTNGLDDIVAAFAKTAKPINFEALDGEDVSLIFLLVGKENLVGPHIKLLSRISRMMNKDEFRKSLMNANSADEIYNMIAEEEKKYIDLI